MTPPDRPSVRQPAPPIVKNQPHRIEATAVTIHLGRWSVQFDIETPEGTQSFIASADSYYTDSDGIWFGTVAEYKEPRW